MIAMAAQGFTLRFANRSKARWYLLLSTLLCVLFGENA